VRVNRVDNRVKRVNKRVKRVNSESEEIQQESEESRQESQHIEGNTHTEATTLNFSMRTPRSSDRVVPSSLRYLNRLKLQ
jgi:hypothetical protein